MATVIPAVTGGQVERKAPGDRITFTVKAGQTVRGGRLVELTADWEIQEAAANSLKVAGVALYDGAAGAKVTVASEGVWLLIASGAIAAGDDVKAGAAGVAVTIPAADATSLATVTVGINDSRRKVGRAMAAAIDTALCPVKLENV
jgi:hypothetical protein